MNKDQIIGNWKQFKGEVRKRWGKLTDDEVDIVEGNRMKLTGQIQKAYGITKEKAEEEVNNWEKECCGK
ncbi:MAG: CsbD family protein [Rickettsiaceae bacterium]|jgi:uncharacterized protein YjbJ (UPF0337 family)|nr:CsbD family protein [Rickettsiaceae bacterium]